MNWLIVFTESRGVSGPSVRQRLGGPWIVIFVSILITTLGVSGQRPGSLTDEPLEEYGDPPAAFWVNGYSPGAVLRYNAFTSRQVNVNSSGLNITGDAANEPSITVDPTNHNRMVVGWRQFDSVASNFRTSGYSYTSTGGASWTFPGVLETGVFRSDPVLFADDTGKIFYNSLLSTFYDNIFRSTNGGSAWTRLQADPNARGGDKQWYTIDNTTSTGHGFQYQAWSTAGNNYGGRQFSRSTDGGVTWLDPVNIPNSPQWGTLDVDSAGNLFIGGVNVSTGQVWCIRSSNARNAAVTPTFDQSTAASLGGTILSGDVINPGGLTGQLFLAVDRSGTATNNNIYMLASVRPTGSSGGSDVMFTRSTNGGQSFSAAKRINDDLPNSSKWHWMSTLAVAPNGRIDVIWLDTRNAANNTDSQLFYSYSTDGGNTFSANVAVSPAFNPLIGYPNQNKMGDYMTIVSDNTGGDVAYSATFNQEEDIYYVRVAPPVTARPVFDFDGDGKTDISIFRPSPGEWWYQRSSNGGTYATQFGSSTDKVVAADLTGDGKTDIAYWRPSTGQWFVLRSEDSSFYSFPFGASGDIPMPADYDGDGKADAAVFRPSTATWYISRSTGGTTITQFGLPTDLPVAADYDGDGKADIAIYRPTGANGAEWWVSKSTGGITAAQFGTAADRAVPGDYTGDGKADLAFWRPATGQWFILRSEDLSYFAFAFGAGGDVPARGDYDGDGKLDVAVFRPSTSTWYAYGTTAGVLIQQFGQSGDLPVPNAFVR